MLPLLIYYVAIIAALSQSQAAVSAISLGQDDNPIQNQGQVSKLLPTSLMKDLSVDLIPQAQSYFIEPELPSSTTVKPTFRRRKTLRPITSLNEKRTKTSTTSQDDPEAQPSSSSQAPFKPIRKAVNTSFGKKRQQRPSTSQRSRSGADEANNSDLNSNNAETNEINTTTEGRSNPETTTPREVLRRKKINPTFSPQLKVDRPNRFVPRRNNNLRTGTVSQVTTSPTEVQENEFSSQSTQDDAPVSRPSFRMGRQGGFILRPKPTSTTAPVPGLFNEDDTVGQKKTYRTRNKPTEATPSEQSGGDLPSTPVELSSQVNSNNEAPTGRRIPSGLQRRPGFRSTKQADIIITYPPIELLPKNYEEESIPPVISQRSRGRPGRLFQQQDSVHESSDNVATSVLSTDLFEGAVSSVKSDSSETPSESEFDNYRPRNLSNRKQNPLDKLSNRQASAKRFLTPKENKKTPEQGTTQAPVLHNPSSLRKRPFSLQNLRNRRLGPGASTTSTTTEVPLVESVDGEKSNSDSQVKVNDNVEETSKVEGTTEDKSAKDKAEEVPAAETPIEPVEEVPQKTLPNLPGKRRSGLLGGRKPLVNRVPQSKPKSIVQTTTDKPSTVETTPTPTCEDGKRYNKVLRKCIPLFALRSG